MNRADLVTLLVNSVITVIFTKVSDGSTRVMKCTLQGEYLPPLTGSNHKRSEEVLPVWSVDDNGWRSFRLDSIQEVII